MFALRRTTLVGALLVLATSSLQAQRRGYIIPAPQGQPRVAGIALPPVTTRTVHRYGYGPGVFRVGETVFGSLPALVTPDGRVLVNYGYGYEEAGRVCPGFYGYSCQSYPPASSTPVDDAPSYVPPIYTAPVFGAPVYPTPVYPTSGYGQRGYALPTSGYGPDGACPSGYVPTGGNPPCIDPVHEPNGNVQPLQSMGGRSASSSRPRTGPVAAPRPRPRANSTARIPAGDR